MRLAVIPFVAALALSLPLPVQAQIMDRSGSARSADEGRRLDARIKSLERTSGLQAATIAGIAERLGLVYSGLSETALFARLESQVEEAIALKDRIADLESKVGEFGKETLRDPAQALVNQAKQAFDEGRFEDAEDALGELVFLRSADRTDTDAAWIEAVQAQARAAELQGSAEDFIRADDLEIKAQKLIKVQAQRLDFMLSLSRAQRGVREGKVFGRRAGLDRAIRIYERELARNNAFEPSSKPKVDSHETYAQAVRLLGQRLGGEEGSALLRKGRDTLLALGGKQEGGRSVAGLPLSIRSEVLAIEEIRTRNIGVVRLLQEYEEDGSMRNLLQNSDLQQKEPGSYTFEQIQLMIRMIDFFQSLSVREDFDLWFATQNADKFEGFKAESGEAFGRGGAFLLGIQIVAMLNDQTLLKLIGLDRQKLGIVEDFSAAPPDVKMELGLAAGRAFISSASISSDDLQFKNGATVPPKASLLALALVLLDDVRKLAETEGHLVHLANANHQIGVTAGLMAQEMKTQQKSEFLAKGRDHLMKSIGIRNRADMPFDWAQTQRQLIEADLALSQYDLENRCSHLKSARELADELFAHYEGIASERGLANIATQIEQIEQGLADGCAVVAGQSVG